MGTLALTGYPGNLRGMISPGVARLRDFNKQSLDKYHR